MKYYIEFPIGYHCNLQCPYCFHQEFFQMDRKGTSGEKYRAERPFTLEQYREWRDAHLTDATEIILHLHGGEPFHPKNVEDVYNIIEFMDKERIDILSNGIQKPENYARLGEFKDKFRRIGFTFHRTLIADKPELVALYEKNLMTIHEFGIPVYVKELLFAKYRDEVIAYKNYWKEK